MMTHPVLFKQGTGIFVISGEDENLKENTYCKGGAGGYIVQ